jgi:hypothetical protein
MCSAADHLSLNSDETDEIHVSAYNRAFHEMDLDWHWSANTYRELAPEAGERDRIRAYLTTRHPHLLKAYDADFLADAIHGMKNRFYDAILASRNGQAPSAAPA